MIRKIIDKAVEGGWKCDDIFLDKEWVELLSREHKIPILTHAIFSHDFLKAYFGEEGIWINDENAPVEYEDWMYTAPGYLEIPEWKYHAKQLVLSEDRIEYLGRYL